MKTLTKVMNQPVTTPAVVGAALWLQLGLARAFASANMGEVFVAGRALHWDCLFKQRFGFPCPTCGMTRSFLLALHGNLGQAFELNPAGLLLLLGLALFSGAMFLLVLYQVLYQRSDAPPSVQRLRQRISFWTTLYAGLVVAVLIVHWVRAVWAF